MVPAFPPKKIFTLTPNDVEQRREQLEKYMQAGEGGGSSSVLCISGVGVHSILFLITSIQKQNLNSNSSIVERKVSYFQRGFYIIEFSHEFISTKLN